MQMSYLGRGLEPWYCLRSIRKRPQRNLWEDHPHRVWRGEGLNLGQVLIKWHVFTGPFQLLSSPRERVASSAALLSLAGNACSRSRTTAQIFLPRCTKAFPTKRWGFSSFTFILNFYRSFTAAIPVSCFADDCQCFTPGWWVLRWDSSEQSWYQLQQYGQQTARLANGSVSGLRPAYFLEPIQNVSDFLYGFASNVKGPYAQAHCYQSERRSYMEFRGHGESRWGRAPGFNTQEAEAV